MRRATDTLFTLGWEYLATIGGDDNIFFLLVVCALK